MAFAHSDYYHSDNTLRAASAKLFQEGILKKSEKELLDEYLYAAEKFKIGGKPFKVHMHVKESGAEVKDDDDSDDDNLQHHVVRDMKKQFGKGKYLFDKTRSTSEQIVQLLGRYVSAEKKTQKQDALANLLLQLKIEPTRERMTPKKLRKSPRRPKPSGKRRVIYFSDLRESEKEKYLSFLVENNVKFFKESGPDGMYTATIRLEPQKPAPKSAKKKSTSDSAKKKTMSRRQAKEMSDKLTRGESLHVYSRHAGRPPAEEQRLVRAMYGNGGETSGEFASYQTFSKLITMKDKLKPRKRPITWLMRLIEEIYDNRFIHDSADFKDDGTSVPGEQAKQRLSHQFPIFVVDFFSKRYGLRNIVDQNCWDLLFNVNLYREKHLEVAIFGRFLEEFYDPDDLLFFLYVRSVIQKEIGVNFRNHWSELGRRGMRDTVWLSYSSCVKVSRVVFVSESDPLFRAFMDMIEVKKSDGEYKHLWGKVTRRSDTRRIQVIQFLHLALAEYHSTRPAEGEEEAADQTRRAERKTGEDSFGLGGKVLVHSKDEQDRLFKEAEAQFEKSQRKGNESKIGEAKATEDSLSRKKRIKELEDRIRSEIAMRRADSAMGGASAPVADDEGNEKVMDAEDGDGNDDDDDDDDAGLLIQAISESIEVCNSNYLDSLMSECDSTKLSDAIKTEIRKEVSVQLSAKVESTLEAVVDSAMTDDDSSNEMVKKFRACRGVPDSSDFRRRVDDFCNSVVQSEDVTQEIEPLVTLLITYALQNYESGDAAESAPRKGGDNDDGGARRPHEHVHISRSGSIDIRMD